MATRSKLQQIYDDVYGVPKRSIPGLRKEVDDLQAFKETMEDFRTELRGMIRGAKWGLGLNLVAAVVIVLYVFGIIGRPAASGNGEIHTGAQVAAAESASDVQLIPTLPLDPLEPIVPDWDSPLQSLFGPPLELISELLFGVP